VSGMLSAADATRIAAVREQLPSCSAGGLYLNVGGAGPLPRVACAAVEAAMDRALVAGRATLDAVAEMEATAEGVRARAAKVIGAGDTEIALTGNTTQGIDVAVWGYDWRPGDEVVTTALEHPGVSVPLGMLARRVGVRVRHVAPGDAGDLAGAVERLTTPRTRMVVTSHVAYGTGEVLDVAGAAEAAHAVGALCVVDGAQSVGAIPVNVSTLGVDVYAFPAHKWLYGPEGLGAVWVAPEATGRLHPTFSGYESGTGHTPDGDIDLHEGARRYEMSTPPMALLGAWSAGLDWMEGLGWEWIHARIRTGHARARAALGALPGVHVITPDGPQAGLVSFAVEGHEAAAACAALAADGVLVRWLEYPPALRASIGFHWCDDDIERLTRAVAAVCGC